MKKVSGSSKIDYYFNFKPYIDIYHPPHRYQLKDTLIPLLNQNNLLSHRHLPAKVLSGLTRWTQIHIFTVMFTSFPVPSPVRNIFPDIPTRQRYGYSVHSVEGIFTRAVRGRDTGAKETRLWLGPFFHSPRRGVWVTCDTDCECVERLSAPSDIIAE